MAQEYKAKLNIFSGQLQLVPTNIVLAFKEGVATHNDLPLTGNAKGDARIANDDGHLWVWSIEASEGLLTDWVDAGDIVDLEWDSINGKPNSSVESIDEAVALQNQVTKTLYVDGNRTDTYTEKGSITKPFKTIQSAINQIITNNDNDTFAYAIKIASGTYTENVLLEDLKLYNVHLIGESCETVIINPASGNSLQSSLNNNNLTNLNFTGIYFVKKVHLEGEINGTTFMSAIFFNGLKDCLVDEELILNNVYFINIDNTLLGDLILINTNLVVIKNLHQGFTATGSFSVTVDLNEKKPAGMGTRGVVDISSVGCTFPTSITLLNGGTFRFRGIGSRVFGIPIINDGVEVHLINSNATGNITVNSGGTLRLYNSKVAGTISGEGTILLYDKASEILNDSNIAGANVKEVLNTLKTGALDIAHTQNTDEYLTTQISKFTRYVDCNRTDIYIEDGSITKPFKTIQAAIDSTPTPIPSGQEVIILIHQGTYFENVILKDGISLKGITAGIPLVKIFSFSGDNITCDSTTKDVALENIMLLNTGDGAYLKINNCTGRITLINIFLYFVGFGTARGLVVSGGGDIPLYDCYFMVKGNAIELSNLISSPILRDTTLYSISENAMVCVNSPIRIISAKFGSASGKKDINADATSIIYWGNVVCDLTKLVYTNRIPYYSELMTTKISDGTYEATIANIDDAVDKKHVQNTDTKLDEGEVNETAASEIRGHIDTIGNPHSTQASEIPTEDSGIDVQDALDSLETDQHTHDNKVELDKLTDGDHDVRTDNPHTVTKDQVSLGNVTNDAQVKASQLIRATFDNGDLAVGKLTITHNLALSAPYSVIVAIFDNNSKQIIPDDVTGATNSVEIDLTSYGTLTGTWGYLLLG